MTRHAASMASADELSQLPSEAGGARACDIEIRSIVRQCADADVACFVKQLGSRPFYWSAPMGHFEADEHDLKLDHRKGGDPDEWPEDLRVRQWPEVS